MKKSYCILAALCLLFNCVSASAQDGVGVGVFSSPKGIGLALETPAAGESFNTFTLYADIYGIIPGRCLYPGYKFIFAHNSVFATVSGDDLLYEFYAGPGASLGYVREYEPYIYTDYRKFLSGNFGAVACASASVGCRVSFPRRKISLNLSWTAEGGVFLDRNEDNPSGFEVSFYRNGLFSALYPQLTISYRF